MSFLQGILGNRQQEQPNQQAQQPPNVQQTQKQVGQSGAQIPKNQAEQGATNDPNTMQSPLDAYASLFDNSASGQNELQAPRFQLAPEAISKAADSLDFLSDLPEELLSEIQQGKPQAFLAAINHVGRKAYSTAISHQSHLTDRFSEANRQYEDKTLGSKIKSHLTQNSVQGLPEAQSHPVVRDSIKRIAQDLQKHHPDASPEQLVQMAKDYYVNIAKSIAPDSFAANQQQKSQGQGAIDWDSYITT